MSVPRPPTSCPCGAGASYDACCGPLHRQERPAETAEALMRSRYSAYALGEVDHVFRTWHPRTRPEGITDRSETRWLGLRILDVVDGGSEDETGEVEFVARYATEAGETELHERSRFSRRAGRWMYVDAVP